MHQYNNKLLILAMIAFKVKSKTLPTIIKHVLQRGNAKETNALPKCSLLTS